MSVDIDVLVVGGGIQGCGVAQAAAAHGYRTLLIEQSRLASGTSSRSSKLIHGGLRYLETWQIPLVYEALHEQEILLRIAAHLVRKERFYIPVYAGNLRPPWQIGAGLSMYALLSWARNSFRIIPKQSWPEVLPGLSHEGLHAVFQYWDAATDDARLTRAVAASARQLGATIREGAALHHAYRENDYWTATFNTGESVRTRLFVNATGPWLESVQKCITAPFTLPPLDYVRGTHILLPQPQEAFVYVEAEARRAMFIMPWQGQTMVGTTETAFSGDPGKVYPAPQEIEQLCSTYHRYYPQRRWQPEAIAGSFAGIRVLPRSSKAFTGRSRSTLLIADQPKHPSVIAVCGGKLTTYRRTAEKIMLFLGRSLPPPQRPINTAELLLPETE